MRSPFVNILVLPNKYVRNLSGIDVAEHIKVTQ